MKLTVGLEVEVFTKILKVPLNTFSLNAAATNSF